MYMINAYEATVLALLMLLKSWRFSSPPAFFMAAVSEKTRKKLREIILLVFTRKPTGLQLDLAFLCLWPGGPEQEHILYMDVEWLENDTFSFWGPNVKVTTELCQHFGGIPKYIAFYL